MNWTYIALGAAALYLFSKRNNRNAAPQPVNTGANTATVADDYLEQVYNPVSGSAGSADIFSGYSASDNVEITGRPLNGADVLGIGTF